MTTTPTVWKPKFFPNAAGTAGDQQRPESIGLANGNILTVWGTMRSAPRPDTTS